MQKALEPPGQRLEVSIDEAAPLQTVSYHIGASGKEQWLVGASGFEPPASWSRTRRSNQAEPRPESP